MTLLANIFSFRFYVNSWGREKANHLKQCRGDSRRCFHMWQNRMRLLKLEKLRIPKQTRFRTFVLLLHPSMKPLDQGTSMEFKISWNQLRYALAQSENSGRSIASTVPSQSMSFGFPSTDDLDRITSRNSFFSRYASASLGAISNIWFHQKTSGFFEIFSESGGEFILFVFSDTFHGPIDLPDHMIPVCDNVSVGKADLGYRSKV